MNKLLLAVALLLVSSSMALANYGPNFPRETDNQAGYDNVAVENTSGTLLSRPVLVYKVELAPNVSNTVVEIYDGTTSASIEVTGNSLEVTSATQYLQAEHVYNPPVQLYNGAYVNFDSGSGKVRVYYR